MSWPITPVSTANLDAGSDEPRLARADLKQAVDNVNAIASEFGNVSVSSATNDQILTKSGGIWSGSNTITNLDLLDLDTAAAQTVTEGQIAWNADDGTIDIGLKGGAVTLQVGQEIVQRVYNSTGSTLTDGQIVAITGAQGNRISVTLANAATESDSTRTFGMVTEPIAAGAEGFVTVEGVVNKLNTSSYSEGTVLWLGTTAGTITSTRPAAPNHGVMVGVVTRQHATVGSIFVKVQNGYELDELHDVLISTPITGQVLQRMGNTWVNANVILDNLGDVSVSSPISNQTLVYNGNTWVNGNVTVSTAGTSAQYLKMDTVFFNIGSLSSDFIEINTTYTELYAGSAGATTSGNVITLATGTYIVEFDSVIVFNAGSQNNSIYYVEVYNKSDSSSIAIADTELTGSIPGPSYLSVTKIPTVKLILTSTKQFVFRHRVSNGGTNSKFEGGGIKITKVA